MVTNSPTLKVQIKKKKKKEEKVSTMPKKKKKNVWVVKEVFIFIKLLLCLTFIKFPSYIFLIKFYHMKLGYVQ